MEKIAPDISYEQLKHISDWRLVEDNQHAALAAVVDGISGLDATSYWGEGKTSASDGQRFAMPHKVLQQTYSTRFNDFAMIGMRFCPRIRSLHYRRIYCADPKRDHGPLEKVPQRGRRAVNFSLIAEQWERIGQFYAAFPTGHTTASAALQRLNRFQASNRFYAANRELGRIFKTEFVLQYMAEHPES